MTELRCSTFTPADRAEQCVGGIPCESCIRTGKTCQKRTSDHSKTIFVFYKETDNPLIPAQVTANTETIHLNYFFAFLGRNHLVHHTDILLEVLLPLVSGSALLSSVARAIGALDASRHGSCGAYGKSEFPQSLAYRSYSYSIESLKTALLDSKVSQRDDILWATFFLGLFEVSLLCYNSDSADRLTRGHSSWSIHLETDGQNICYMEHLVCCRLPVPSRGFLGPAVLFLISSESLRQIERSFMERAPFYLALTGPRSIKWTTIGP